MNAETREAIRGELLLTSDAELDIIVDGAEANGAQSPADVIAYFAGIVAKHGSIEGRRIA